eukprot:Em0004g152a
MALFTGVQLASWDPLRAVKSRAVCPKCHSSRKFFCYTCYEVVGLQPEVLPTVTLPVSVDIIKHPGEVAGKSTAVHARILSPRHVSIYDYPTVPDYPDLAKVVLVYPKEDALTIPELAARLKSRIPEGQTKGSVWDLLDKVIFIDSTWQQTHRILIDEKIQKLTCVKLTDAVTCFWRPQAKSPNCLATIEAIYYFFKELDSCMSPGPYTGCYDNLLYFYAYQYSIVHRAQEEKRVAAGDEANCSDQSSSTS